MVLVGVGCGMDLDADGDGIVTVVNIAETLVDIVETLVGDVERRLGRPTPTAEVDALIPEVLREMKVGTPSV